MRLINREIQMSRSEVCFAHAVLSSDFFLRSLAYITSQIDGDIRLAVAFVAIYAANVRKITSSNLNLRYGGLANTPPSTMLKPVTVSAISQSLGLPYETMRRHVRILEKCGLCAREKRGIVVSSTFFANEERIQEMIKATFTKFTFFLEGLKAIQFDVGKSLRSGSIQAERDISDSFRLAGRAVLRLCTDFRLEVLDIIVTTYDGDFLLGLVHLCVLNANVGDSYYNLTRETHRYLELSPISVRNLAKRVGLPFETTRRHVHKLLKMGALDETSNGVIIRIAELRKQKYRRAGRRLEVETSRLLGKLTTVGVNLREFAG